MINKPLTSRVGKLGYTVVMARADKRLEKMRRNPDGWRMEEVEALCRSFDIDCDPPPGGGSHYTVGHHSQPDKPTVVSKKPAVKPFYIKRLVSFVDRVQSWRLENDESERLRDYPPVPL